MQTHDVHEASAIGGMVYADILLLKVLNQGSLMSWELRKDHFFPKIFGSLLEGQNLPQI